MWQGGNGLRVFEDLRNGVMVKVLLSHVKILQDSIWLWMCFKERKTVQAGGVALKSAEKKTKQTLKVDIWALSNFS